MGDGVAALGGISDLSITNNGNAIDLTLDAEDKVEIDEYLPMEDVENIYFVISSAQYDDYKRIIVKSGEDVLASTVADADNYEFTIGIDHAVIDGDITVEVNPLNGLIYFSNSGSDDSNVYTATFYDSEDTVLATRNGTSTIYVEDFDIEDVAKVSFTRAEGLDYDGIRVVLTAGNYDDGSIVYTELSDDTNTVTYTGDFTSCKYIGVEYQDW